jgi:hypothetical protein
MLVLARYGGLSDQPLEAGAASYDDLQQDLLALLDALSF